MTKGGNILAPQYAGLLRDFAASNVVLVFDYDGSLAPIASVPERARIRTATRRLLVSVAERYPCVVVSGRRLDDLAPRLEGIPLRMVFGNFGYEPAPAGRHPPADVATWVATLTRRLPLQDGLVIEDKQYSVAIHFRHARRPKEARRAISSAVRGLHGARVLRGRKMVTLLPQGGPDKGTAMQSARRALECDTALYVGDDGTDESAFGSAPPESLLAIRVGKTGETRARFHLERQADINALLRVLLALRSEEWTALDPERDRARRFGTRSTPGSAPPVPQ